MTGQREFTRDQRYYIKSRLLKKIKTFYWNELPLLNQEDYLQRYLAACSKNLAAGCKVVSNNDDGKGMSLTKSDVNIMFESEAHTERGSPSLVGRGIANPMSERTRGFEMLPSLLPRC